MAFKREYIENSNQEVGQTSSPLDSERSLQDSYNLKTSDSKQVTQEYDDDTKPVKGQISTGAVVPTDLTVKLVRADSANWEIFVTALNSITLTFFGLFLGVWVSDANQTTHNFTLLEKIATLFFLLISFTLIIIWIVLKVKQSKRGVRIPQDFLTKFENSENRR